MTASQFIAECEKRTIAPGIAIENPEVTAALFDRDDAAVIKALDAEF